LREEHPSLEEQRQAYLSGERRNPLTTNPTGGRILSALQLPWFMLLPPCGFGVLTTTGHTSGKKRRKCVRVIRSGDKAYLVSLRGPYGAWFRNLRAQPQVRLRIRGGSFDGFAHEISDPSEYEEAKDIYRGTLNPLDRMEYRMHRRGRPTPERIRALHERWFRVGTPVVIELSARS
jgi:deazaflavin-dependent oxidoreductase (nitroreductase family)